MLSDAQRSALTARLRQGRAAATGRGGPVAAAGRSGPVVQLNGGAGVPAFAPHAVAGTVYEYTALARELDGAYRLYGIEAGGLRAGTTPGASLAEMADRYAGAVRDTQESGPYRLIGWSMGGVLAFEVARRLEQRGERADLVVLIDTPYRVVTSFADSEPELAALFVAEVTRGARGPAGRANPPPAHGSVAERLDWLAEALSGGAAASGDAAQSGDAAVPGDVAVPGDLAVSGGGDRSRMRAALARRFDVFRAHTDALAGYRPTGPVTADAILISAHGSPDSAPDWSGMFRGDVRTASSWADHDACLRPPAVDEIATLIRTWAAPAGPGRG
ncbi:MAG TPA: thioesterase domain-containing protein [Micromonosporaceae bacterium]